jgi:hypothetical protein
MGASVTIMNYAPKVMREDDRTMLLSSLSSFGRRRHRPWGACTPVIVRSTRRRPHVEASGSRVDVLLHDDGDEAIVVIPHHTSSVAASLFVAHHPRHHHPCRPWPSSSPLLPSLARHPRHRCPLPSRPLRLCPNHRSAMRFCCLSPPAVVLVSTARLQLSHC